MNRLRPILWLSIAAAGALLALAGPVGRAAAQFNPFSSSSQFELADTVQVDRVDATVLAQLERAKAALADRQWDDAVETLRQVMETSEGRLIGVTEHRYISLSDYCQLRLASLPPEALRLYRSRVDSVAQKWYEDGARRRDRRLLQSVVEQTFASTWGDKALLALGEMDLESGDYASACWHWERILPAELPAGSPKTWPGYPDTRLDLAAVRARLVLVSVLEGSPDRARDELAQFVRLHADARGRLGGREVNYAAALGELLQQSGSWPRPKPDPDWPTFAGSPSRNRTAPENVDVGAVAWRIAIPRLAPAARSAATPISGVAEDAAVPLSYHPIVVGGRVFVGNQQEIHAARVADGKPAWGDAPAAVYREQWEGPASGLAPADNLGVPRFTLTARDARLYARMGGAVTGRPQQSSTTVAAGCLVCLDLEAEGRLLWKIAPDDGWAFEGAPLADGNNVYVAMRRNDIRPQAHVACFDAQSGRPRWRRFIVSAETPARGVLFETTQNLLTLDGRTLYFNTNLGAVAAIAADRGRVRWVSLYPRARRGDLLRLAPHWRRDLNPCMVDHGTLLVAPADTPHVLALDASTGQLLWPADPQAEASDTEDVVHLLGVAGDCLIASGRKLYWIGLRDAQRGRIKHVWPDGPDRPGYGRGLLAGDSVLWPTRQKIYVFDRTTAQPKKVIDLAPLGITGGNLLVAGGRLLVATGTELIALGPGSAAGKQAATELTRRTGRPTGIYLLDAH